MSVTIKDSEYRNYDLIMVSVVVTCYNHELYIAKTINSFLHQKTNFRVEILINDDASSDNSVGIIKKYQAQYPDLIVTFFQIENQYSKGKKPWLEVLFPFAKGKYIALCDGDDYWTDPYKLQKQVDFMEANSDYSMCFTRYKRYFEDTKLFQLSGHNHSRSYNLKDFMYANHAATATVLFKNIHFDLNYFSNTPFGDWTLYNLILQNGDAYYMDDVTAVYRRHSLNSEYYNPTPYKKKLYKLNFLFLKIHGVKYVYIFFKKIIKMSIFNKLD